MATTANGYIARLDDSTPWSDEEWKAYSEEVKKIGNIIIGRRTYEIMKHDELDKIGNPLVIVVGSTAYPVGPNVVFVKTPEEALRAVEQKGFSSTTINGGGALLSSFGSKGLIDEVVLDIEPFLFGNGIPLFKQNAFEFNLSLTGVKRIGSNTLQVRYKVIK